MSQTYRIEDPWCRYIPLLHRILADPLTAEEFPRVSERVPLEDPCAVWETLHYLLRFLLGWEDPGIGLSWWYAHGKPVEDSPLLDAVNRWWDGGYMLDFYSAWAWSESRSHLSKEDGTTANRADDTWYANEQWWVEFRRRPQPPGGDPYHGGSNPLHLGHSDWFGLDELKPDRACLHFDVRTRQAALIVNHLGSWLRDLQRVGQRLPEVGERSWHVEVFDRQTGYLGLFRRSRETGRWFQGKHSVHVRGQRQRVKGVTE